MVTPRLDPARAALEETAREEAPALYDKAGVERWATCTCAYAITTLRPHDASGDNSDRVSPLPLQSASPHALRA